MATDSTVVSGAPPPRRIGRYMLLERLGVGGMAEVYLAQQDGAVGFQKKVVVKRILPHLAADPQFVEMFAREAKVAARLSHANVVQIVELGEGGGELFLAMEYLDGLTLHRLASASWERGWAVPVDVVLRTVADAATGLHAAHALTDENGRSLHLVHRDVSPDNLMVSKDGVTKVLDFGIAKGDVGGPKTKTGHLRGKIPFMPPEQITGEQVDPRADLYALGVSMYWMLTGERPFDRQSDWHTMHAILHDTPKPPSSLNPSVTPGLDALILQLLEKNREQRPASGREVADRLEELASPGSVGGKKTTVQFLAQLLPATTQRGNPVSDVAPIPAPAPGAAVNATAPAYEAAARLVSSQLSDEGAPVKATPAPVSSVAPLAAAAPAAAEPVAEPRTAVLDAATAPTPAPTPAPMAAESQAPAPPSARRVVSEDDVAIRPVTTPAAPNAIADVLTPKPRSGPPVALIALGLVVVVVVVVVAIVAAGRRGQTAGGVDAGTVVTAPPPPPTTSPPPPPPPPPVVAPATVDVRAVNTPSRVRWRAGDAVVGLGSGTLTVPAGTKSLIAEDLRWKSTATVAVVDGVADYDSAPAGIVQLVRTDDKTTVTLAGDDISRQRKLRLPVGRYIFVVERKGQKKEVPIEVAAGKTFTVDAGR
jgi:serine/threonine-protein kinase